MRWRTKNCAVLLVAAGVLASQGEEVVKAQRAAAALKAGRFGEAERLYRELVRELPGNPGMLMNLGLALHSAGKYTEAIPVFERVLKLQPGFSPALLMLGLAHQKMGEPGKAVEPLSLAVKADPQNRIALLELADACLALGRNDEAAANFRRLTELAPQAPKGWQGLGLSYLALARRAFERLEKIAPSSAYWYELLARSKAEQGEYGAAFRLYRQALALAPNLPGVHRELADIYRKTGHNDWARIEESREAPAYPKHANPAAGSPEFYYRQAKRYGSLALEAFARLSRLPPSAEVHELTAEAYRIQGLYRASADELREALELDPGNARLERELARSLWLDNDFQGARDLLLELVKSEPASAEMNYQLGDCLLHLGDVEGAIRYLAVAVERAPKLLPAHASLGRAYLRTGNAARAARHLETALSLDEDGSVHYQLSRAYAQLGRQADAGRMLHAYERISAGREAKDRERNAARQITPP